MAHKNISVFFLRYLHLVGHMEKEGTWDCPLFPSNHLLGNCCWGLCSYPSSSPVTLQYNHSLGCYNTMPQTWVILNSMHLQVGSPIQRYQQIQCLLRVFFFQWWVLSVSSHGRRVWGSPKLLLGEVSPTQEDLPSWLNNILKSLPVNTITLCIKFQHMNLRAHKHSDYRGVISLG